MAIIVVRDLPESVDLDRRAMVAITGGARVRGPQSLLGRTVFRGIPISTAPTGFARNAMVDANGRSAGSTPRK